MITILYTVNTNYADYLVSSKNESQNNDISNANTERLKEEIDICMYLSECIL